LEESYIDFATLFEKMPEGVVYEDSDGLPIRMNPAAEQMLGLSLAQIRGDTPIDPGWHAIHLDGSNYEIQSHATLNSLRTGLPVKNEIMGIFNPKQNKYKWISMNSTPEFKPGEDKPFQVFATFRDITEQIEAEQKLKAKSDLLKLLVFTSTSYINLPEIKLQETINLSLQKLGEYVNADRMYVFDYNWEKKICSNTYEWCADGIASQIELLQEVPLQGLEEWTEQHIRGELMYVENVLSLNKDSALKQILEPQGVISLLAMPIMDNDACTGFIGLDSVRSQYTYNENEVALLKIFTGVLSNVKNRMDSERQLKKRVKELNSIYQISNLTIRDDIPQDTLLQKIVEIIPQGFFEPLITHARIIFQGKTFESAGFQFESNYIEEKIFLNTVEVGTVLVSLPKGAQFLPEEYKLIPAICNIIGQQFKSKINLIETQKNERQLQNLLNSQTSYMLRTDLEGKHTYWNEKFKQDFAWIYDQNGLYQENSLKSICDYHHERTIETVQNCIQYPGEIFSVELDKPGKDKTILTTLWEFVALVDESGTPTEIQCMGINITDRKKTETKLIESEEKYRFLFEESPDGYLVIKNEKFIDCNRAAEKMVLASKGELLGKSPADISPDFQPNGRRSSDFIKEIIELTLKNGQTEFEWLHTKKDGSEFLAEIKLSKLEKNGEETLFTTWRDITEKRKTEIALLKSEDRFKQIAEHTGSVIWEVDRTGLYTYLSPVAKRVFGYDPEEIVGKKYFWEIFPENQREELKKEGLKFIQGYLELLDWENPIQRKDGKVIWVSSFGAAIRNNEGEIIGYRGADYDISSRKIAEEEMRKFRIISDQASYGTVITEFETKKITYCNKAFAKMHGYEMHELIGLDIFHLHTPEQLEFYLKNIYPEYKLNKEYSVKEFGRKRKDGSTFPALVTAKQFYDEAGIPLFNAATVIDITEKKNIEEQIREQNLRFKAIIDAIPDLIYIMDQDGNYTEYFSSNLENYIGDFNYLVGKNLKDVFTEADSDLHLSKISKALAENKIQTYEYAGMKGFEDRFFESRLIPMTNKKVLRFVREITERKRSEIEIQKLNLAIEQSPIAIIITDPKGNLEYMNPEFYKMTGYSHEELIGKPIGLIKSGLTDPKVYHDLWQTINSGKNWHSEWQNMKKSGELFWENISITPIMNHERKIKNFLAVKQDITERKKYEEEIVSLNANLEERIIQRTKELEKTNSELEIARNQADLANQAKSEFLSRMSHELRTPLNSILGFAQLLRLTELTTSQNKNLDYILKSGQHLLQLINEVLEIARIESGKISISLEPINLINTIEEIISLVMPFSFDKSVDIDFSHDEIKTCFILADTQKVKQILINLLNNAIKYNNEDGDVLIYLQKIPKDDGRQFIRINVQDNGIGISEENIQKLFRPFERAGNDNSQIEGTGLGLSVVKKLTLLMGGDLGVESSLGIGSNFWIEFPEISTVDVTETKNPDSSPKSFNPISEGKLLLIEDNVSNIQLIKELLLRLKPKSRLISTMYGLESLTLAKKHRPSLILLDLNLPDTHGSKVLEILKSNPETNEIPVIVLSADATKKQIEEMTKKGAEHYISKPLNISEMITIFDHYLKPTQNEK